MRYSTSEPKKQLQTKMPHDPEIIDLTKRYFSQQAELYGKNFYVEPQMFFSDAAPSLHDFFLEIKDCQKCALSRSRTNFVFGTGNPDANLMCIGEAPGQEEDIKGEPFVGAAGQLLDRILAAIGFERQEVYIANIVKCRPPQNRDPEPEEAETCLPYLQKQIEMIQPKLILALGRVAAQCLLKTDESLNELRGKTHRFQSANVLVTYHPAALLRNQQWKRETWEDVKKLRRLYDEMVGDKPQIKLR